MTDRSIQSIENLSPHEWITPLEPYKLTLPGKEGEDVTLTLPPSGIPLEVLAVDTPFLVVRTPSGVTWTMDGRRLTSWKKLETSYVLHVLAAYAAGAIPSKSA